MKKLFYIFIILSQVSCLNMVEPKYQAEYIEIYNSFDKELINHFPKKLPNNYIASGLMSPKRISYDFNYLDIYLKVQISSRKKYEIKKRSLIKKTKITKNSDDRCLLIIKYDWEKIKLNQDISGCDRLFPVPYDAVYNYNRDEGVYKKQKDNEIAFIDYKPRKLMEKLLTKENLPEQWKNGYSKGYTFNDNNQTITYWLVIW